jgi:hypothetical protein
MANELDSHGEWQRMVDRYRDMSDGELLALASGIDDLTETAGDVLRGVLQERGLRMEAPASAAANVPRVVASEGWSSGRSGAGSGEVALMTFHDAMSAGRACDFLEDGEVEFEMKDVSTIQAGYGRAVSLDLIVHPKDRERAMAILRETMGLFPLQEVDVADEAVDDGTIATLGGFGEREEAEGVGLVLEDAGIWHRLVPNPEGTVEDENRYRLEVREVDLVHAGEVVEDALHFPED